MLAPSVTKSAPLVSKYTANLGLQYRHPLRSQLSAFVRSDVEVIGPTWFYPDNFTVRDPVTQALTEPVIPPSVLHFSNFPSEALDGGRSDRQRHALLLAIQAPPKASLQAFVNPVSESGGHFEDETFRPHGWLLVGDNHGGSWPDWRAFPNFGAPTKPGPS